MAGTERGRGENSWRGSQRQDEEPHHVGPVRTFSKWSQKYFLMLRI